MPDGEPGEAIDPLGPEDRIIRPTTLSFLDLYLLAKTSDWNFILNYLPLFEQIIFTHGGIPLGVSL